MEITEIVQKAETKDQKKITQSNFNTNVAFYIHLKEYNNNVRAELEERLTEVFFFSKGVDWNFDSFGIEKAGSRSRDVLGYFIFKAVEVEKLQKLFFEEFKDYENASRITCSVAKYEKVKEQFFELSV